MAREPLASLPGAFPFPIMTHDPETKIVLALPRSTKGRYVAASRAAGQTLFGWILATLDAASQPIPLRHDSTPRPRESTSDDPRPG